MAEEVAEVVAVAEPVPVAEMSVTDALKAVLLKARIHDGLKRGLHEYVAPSPSFLFSPFFCRDRPLVTAGVRRCVSEPSGMVSRSACHAWP